MRFLIALVSVTLVASLAHSARPAPAPGCKAASRPAGSKLISILSYNVENLFDVEHDSSKIDWEFLPAGYPGRDAYCQGLRTSKEQKQCLETDWTADKLELKIKQIKKVVDLASPILPEIMGVSEIENENVVRKLANELCYRDIIVTDSPDVRGIDVGIMYNSSANLKYLNHIEHHLDPAISGKPSRNVLQVNFLVGGHNLIVFMNHWPSQGAPAPVRVAVAKFVQEKVKQAIDADPSATVVVMGDFNVISNDRPDPFFNVLENPAAGTAQLFDVDSKWRGALKSTQNYTELNAMPLATYFYGVEASFNLLDRFFVNKNATDGRGLEVDVNKYRIVTAPEITSTWGYPKGHWLSGSIVRGIPRRYDHNATDAAKAGYSDHFPIYLEMKW